MKKIINISFVLLLITFACTDQKKTISELTLKEVLPFTYCALEVRGSWGQYKDKLKQLSEEVQKQGIVVDGEVISVWRSYPNATEEKDYKWEVGYKIAEGTTIESPLVTKKWKTKNLYSQSYDGPSDGVTDFFKNYWAWFEDNNLKVIRPLMEIEPPSEQIGEGRSKFKALVQAVNDDFSNIPADIQAISFLGEALYQFEPTERALEGYNKAKLAYERNPDNPDSLVRYGRFAVRKGDFIEGIKIFSEGIKKHPNNPVMYRRRGHRYISTRQIDKALLDFEKAVELNEKNPVNDYLTLDIWYHYGLAYFINRDFENAAKCYEKCFGLLDDAAAKVSVANWRYMSLARAGNTEGIQEILDPINDEMEAKGETMYKNLLLFYKGELTLEEVTARSTGGQSGQDSAFYFGIGNYYFVKGEIEKAKKYFKKASDDDDRWPGFGHIAAEKELSQL